MVIDEQTALGIWRSIPNLDEDRKAKAARILGDYKSQQERLEQPLWPSQMAAMEKRKERTRSVFDNPLVLDAEDGTFAAADAVEQGTGDRMRKREANILFLADQYQADEGDVRQRYDHYKAEVGAKWGTGTLDDDAFFNRAKGEVTKEKETESRRVLLQQQAATAALTGSGFLDSLATVDAQDEGDKMAYRNAYTRTSKKLAPYRSVISDVAKEGKRMMTSGEGADWGALAEKLLTVPKKDRQLVLDALGQVQGEEVEGGATNQLLNAFARGLENYIDRAGAGAAGFVGEQLQGKAEFATGVAGLVGMADEEDGRALTQLDIKKDKLDEIRELEQDARAIAAGTLSPLRDVRVLGMNLTGAAENLPMTVGSFVPIVGPAAMVGFFKDATDEELRREYPDMDRGERQKIATLSAPIQAATEVISDRLLFGRLPNLKRAFTSPAFSATAVGKQLAGRVILGTATETVEELAQGVTSRAVMELQGALGADVPDVNWEGYFSRFGEDLLELLSTVVPLALLGAGVGQVSDYQNARALVSNDTLLKAAGYDNATEIKAAADAGKWSEVQTLMRAGWAKVAPKGESVGEVAAEAQETVTKARTAEVKAATAEVVKMRESVEEARAVIDRAEKAALIPRIRGSNATGWTVEDTQTGAVVRVKTREDAVSIAYESLSEMERTSAAAMAQAAEEFMDLRPGAAEAIEINTQSRTMVEEVEVGRVTPEQAQQAVELFGQMHGLNPGEAKAEALTVLGNNKAEMIEGVRTAVSRIWGGGNLITVMHEGIHGRWRAGLEKGHYTQAMGVQWVRMAERATGVQFLPVTNDAQVTPEMLDEAIVEVASADIVGRRKDGKQHFTPGLISRGVASFALAGRADARAAGRFATWLKSWKEFWGVVLSNAKKLKKARAEGKLGGDFDAFLDDLLGAEPQQRFEAEAAREAVEMTGEVETDNAPFSLARVVLPTQYPESARKVVATTNVGTLIKALLKPGEALVVLDETKEKPMMVSPAYKAAKRSGDKQAAWDIASKFIDKQRVDEYRNALAGKNPVFVPMQQREGERVNMLPLAAAHALQKHLGGRVSDEVHQIKKGGNTGATVKERGNKQHAFVGSISLQPNEIIVLVDDTFTSGNTLAAAYDYLSGQGLESQNIFTIATGRYGKDMAATPERQQATLDRMGLDRASFEDATGYPIEAYTGAELQGYLLGRGDPGIQGFLDRFHEGGNQRGAQVVRQTDGGEVKFSLAPRSLASVADTVLASKMKKPEFREVFYALAREKMAKLRSDGEWKVSFGTIATRRTGTDTMAANTRTASNIENERKFRFRSRQRELLEAGMNDLSPNQMMALERGAEKWEDRPRLAGIFADGKLMSKTTATKLGKYDPKQHGDYDAAPGWLPPAMYGKGDSGTMPDVMAQRAFDNGLIPEPTPDALWEVVKAEMDTLVKGNEEARSAQRAVREVEQKAAKQAREESDAWAKDQKAKVPTPKQKQLAALRTLDAILSAFPAEIRGQVGGFVKLASLGTDKAREAEIVKRLEKLDKVVEKAAKKHYLDAIEKGFKRFGIKKDDKGRVTSNVTAAAAEEINFAYEFAEMDDANQDKEMASLEKIIDESEDSSEQQDAIGRLAIANLFYKLEKRDSAELEATAEWLTETGSVARETRKVMDAARAEWVKAAKEAAKSDSVNGKLSSLPDAENVEADTRSTTFKRFTADVKGFLNSALFTMGQQLEIVFGQDSRITKEFHQRGVKAANQSTDIKRDIEGRRAAFVAQLFGTDSKIKQAGRMGALSVPAASGITITTGGKTKTVDVPGEVIERIIEGKADLKALGLTKEEAAILAEEWAINEALPGNRRRSVFQVERRGEGQDVELVMSQDEAIQYYLWSKQAASREQMERDGWSEESLAQLDKFLSDDAKALAGFFEAEYANLGRLINPVYRRMFNAPFPQVRNYSPIFRDISKADSIIDLDQQGQGSGVSSGFILARNKNARSAMRRTSAISNFMQHAESSAHWISHVELVRDLRTGRAN
jgi:hypothetical protein